MSGDNGLRGMMEQVLHELLSTELKSAVSHAPSITVATYAGLWIAQRRQLKLLSVDDDETRLNLHALPALGRLNMTEVRPRHIRDLILDLRRENQLAPRTVRHVYAALSNMFRCAVADEVIITSPCVLPRGVVPPVSDRDPEWRATAVFNRRELEALLFHHRLDQDHRVLYGLKGLAALRHGEAATLRWEQVVPREPLDAIFLGRTKSKQPRAVPVHPALKWLLDVWRVSGWRALIGRSPRPTDLVIPGRRAKTVRASTTSQHDLGRDLALLGLRHRRGHDLRRTMITLARADGARDEILRAITHGPRPDIQEQYTSWPWEVLCGEMSKLQIDNSRVGDQQELFPAAGSIPARHESTHPHPKAKRAQ